MNQLDHNDQAVGGQSKKVRVPVTSAEAYAGFSFTIAVQIDTPGTINAGTSPHREPRSQLQGEPRLRRQAHRHRLSQTG